MLARVRVFLELVRFSHTLFALPFALTSAALAWRDKWRDKPFRLAEFALDLVGILLCMVFARSAAMAFNRLADRHYDAANPRTAKRHLPLGIVTPAAVAVFTLACAAAFVASTLILVASSGNWLPFDFSVPTLLFICTYSYTKRFTALAHFWLGVSLLLAPVAAWVAVRGFSHIQLAVLLGIGVMFWVAGFDILYACQDVDYDRKAKLASVPAKFGVRASLRTALLCHVAMLVALFALFFLPETGLGWVYLIGVVAVGCLLAFEHWLVRPEDLSRVNQAFFQVNGVISVGLFIIVLVQLLVSG
jgi:4-hydroxybenzoate polyprenyltransferase